MFRAGSVLCRMIALMAEPLWRLVAQCFDRSRARRHSRPKKGQCLQGQAGGGSQRPDIDPITLSIEAKLRRAGKGKRLVIEIGAETEVNAGLVGLIKEAFTVRNQFLSGSPDTSATERTSDFVNLGSNPGSSARGLERPAAVRAPHPGVLRLWLAPMRSPER